MKKTISLLLCLVLIAGLAATVRATENMIDLGQTWDESILAGGIYDMFAWVGEDTEDYTFQWQVDMSIGDGSWYDLEDNANPYGYRGTQTYHLELVTRMGEGQVLGGGWEDIPFRCVVTHKKTGATRATPNMYMNIFTSSDLDSYMQKKGIELYTPGITGATEVTTTDDMTYYSTAQVGKAMNFICGFKPPQNDPLMGRSELVGNVEVWITEDGKTVKRENGGSYTPYTIGKDAVTVQFKLHYTLGIHDLGYYETKTIQLTTVEPETIGYATAKSEASLLREQYSQSQKLVSFPKGAVLKVVGQSGSWYQVVHGGYIGYVPVTSVTYKEGSPVIDHVNVNIAEPLPGNLPATSNTATPDTCFVTYVDWMDQTEDRFMQPGERFVKGHTYRLVMWVSAKEGYEFKLDSKEQMLATATINNRWPATTTRAYEQIIGKVMEMYFDFVNVQETEERHTCSPVYVERKEPTCTQKGQQAHYKCACGKTYADAAATQEVKLSTWGVIPAAGHKAGAWTGNGTHHYKKCTVCTEVIPGTNAPHAGGKVLCEQKPVCATCSMTYGSYGAHNYSGKFIPILDEGHAHMCQGENCTAHDTVKPHTPGPAATETAAQTCTECGYVIVPAKSHTHVYQKVEAVAATCLTPGKQAYYACESCSGWWSDAEGKEPIQDKSTVVLPALGHFSGESWSYDEQSHWQSCVICMVLLENGQAEHADQDLDGVCDVCGHTRQAADAPAPTQPQATTPPPAVQEEDGGTDPLIPVLVAVVSFSVAITATVIALKKKE